jgi:hypothetical protein
MAMNDLTELPELWCIKDCKAVSKYASKKYHCSDTVGTNYFHHLKEGNNASCYGFYSRPRTPHTEITFEQFQEWVLTPPLKGLYYVKITKCSKPTYWYKSEIGKIYICDELGVCGYGVVGGGTIDEDDCEIHQPIEFSLQYTPEVTEHFYNHMKQWCEKNNTKGNKYRNHTTDTFDQWKAHGYYLFTTMGLNRETNNVDFLGWGIDNNKQSCPNKTLQEVKQIIGYVEEMELKKWSKGTFVLILEDNAGGNNLRNGDIAEIKSSDYEMVNYTNGYGNYIDREKKDEIKWFATEQEAEEYKKLKSPSPTPPPKLPTVEPNKFKEGDWVYFKPNWNTKGHHGEYSPISSMKGYKINGVGVYDWNDGGGKVNNVGINVIYGGWIPADTVEYLHLLLKPNTYFELTNSRGTYIVKVDRYEKGFIFTQKFIINELIYKLGSFKLDEITSIRQMFSHEFNKYEDGDVEFEKLTVDNLVEDEIYVFDGCYINHIKRQNNYIGAYIELNGLKFYSNVDATNSTKNIRHATKEEKHWLRVCIKQNKLIPKEEILKYDFDGNFIITNDPRQHPKIISKLDKWLEDTKNKNLTEQQLQKEIAHCDYDNIYKKLEGKHSEDKANILYNQWNAFPKYMCSEPYLNGDIVWLETLVDLKKNGRVIVPKGSKTWSEKCELIDSFHIENNKYMVNFAKSNFRVIEPRPNILLDYLDIVMPKTNTPTINCINGSTLSNGGDITIASGYVGVYYDASMEYGDFRIRPNTNTVLEMQSPIIIKKKQTKHKIKLK